MTTNLLCCVSDLSPLGRETYFISKTKNVHYEVGAEAEEKADHKYKKHILDLENKIRWKDESYKLI